MNHSILQQQQQKIFINKQIPYHQSAMYDQVLLLLLLLFSL